MLRHLLLVLFNFLIISLLYAQTPTLVKDINPGSGSSYGGCGSPGSNYKVNAVAEVNSIAYFKADDGVHGVELWRSDGTPVGTFIVKDINPGGASGIIIYDGITNINGILYFGADDGVHGYEVWRSDGTPAGTFLIRDINPGSGSGSFGLTIISINDIICFSADDGVHGSELWRSDGTAAGTFLIKDINPFDPTKSPGFNDNVGLRSEIYNVNGVIYFAADDNIHGIELWRSDGTPAGTFLIKDILPGSGSSWDINTFTITNVNGIAYIIANDGVHGSELWRSDGTSAGTFLVKDIKPGYGSSYSYLGRSIINVNGIAYFGADDDVHGVELWRSDGTSDGTFLIRDINPGSESSFVGYGGITEAGGIAYFGAGDGVHGFELWRSNGTPAGTFLVKDINVDNGITSNGLTYAEYGGSIINVNGVLYFAANDSVHGFELWHSDGTLAGTFLTKDINPGGSNGLSVPYGCYITNVNVNKILYFTADDGVHGAELWRVGTNTTQHFHQIPQSLSFQKRQLLAQGDDFKVCADGSEASIFKVSGGDYDYSQAVIKIPGADASQIGSFSVIQQDKDSLVVRYTHPDYIQTPGSSVTLVAGVYATPGSTTPIITFDITVYRAPVLMTHGLWSGSESFAKMENELVKSFLYPSSPKLIRRADYSTTNSLAFAANVPKIKTEAELLIKSIRDAGIAAGNVDYIGHSMGGILGRLYLQGDTYQCGFHKLITVNTPHSGSQLANLLTKGIDALPRSAGILCRDIIPIASYATGDACGSGAIDNLRVDSPEITTTLNGIRRNYRTVPSHAIATVDYQTVKEIKDTFFGEGEPVQKPDGSYDATRISKKIIKAIGAANEYKDVIALADVSAHLLLDIGGSALFDGPNDYVVSQVSQQGGMTGNCTTTIENQAHTGSPENDQVIERVKSLLTAAPSSASFCQYFDPININKSAPPLIIPNGNIAVTSPKVGLRLQPGAQGILNGNGTDLTEVRAVIEYSSTEILTVKSTGNTIVCNFPVSNETGLKRVVIIGKTSVGGYVSDTTYFYVGYGIPSGSCESIQSGDWGSATTWSCGHEPTATDLVTINPGHAVTISTSAAQASRIIYKGGKIIFATTSAKVFLKGGD